MISKESLYNEIMSFLDTEGSYTDYNQKIEDVMEEFGVSEEEASGYVWTWASEIDKVYDNNEDDWVEDEEDFEESVKFKEASEKSYWKYYMNDPVLDEMYNDENYLDEKTVRKVKLYPCDNEKDCYEGDFSWAVCSYEYPYGAVFCTKEEAYKYLMISWNNSMFEYIHDL